MLLFTGAAGADAHVQRVKESLSSTISSLMGSVFSSLGGGGACWLHLANTMKRCCCLQEQLVQMRSEVQRVKESSSSAIGSFISSIFSSRSTVTKQHKPAKPTAVSSLSHQHPDGLVDYTR